HRVHSRDHDHRHPQATDGRRRSGFLHAWSVVASVGIRPCSGAIIILVFAWSQGLFAAGVAATFVMAVGTCLTGPTLAPLAVSAKGLVLRLAGAGSGGTLALRLARGVEIAGAAVVLLLGLVLLGGALGSAGGLAAAS